MISLAGSGRSFPLSCVLLVRANVILSGHRDGTKNGSWEEGGAISAAWNEGRDGCGERWARRWAVDRLTDDFFL